RATNQRDKIASSHCCAKTACQLRTSDQEITTGEIGGGDQIAMQKPELLAPAQQSHCAAANGLP
ncbi:MAG: hypothetical protein WAN75_22725, partial [Xanthobacteraceae bacterium]